MGMVNAGGKSRAGRILGKQVMLYTIKGREEKFGRYLVRLYLGDELLNDWMV